MKIEKILNLTVEEFWGMLNKENKEYVSESYPHIARALEVYQIGAESFSNESDEYIDANEYFDLVKEREEY